MALAVAGAVDERAEAWLLGRRAPCAGLLRGLRAAGASSQAIYGRKEKNRAQKERGKTAACVWKTCAANPLQLRHSWPPERGQEYVRKAIMGDICRVLVEGPADVLWLCDRLTV